MLGKEWESLCIPVVFQLDQVNGYIPTYLSWGLTHPENNTHDAFHFTALRSPIAFVANILFFCSNCIAAAELLGRMAAQRPSPPDIRAATPVDPRKLEYDFDPCAATASIFLYCEDTDIICLHHDTLAIERRFERHKERILFVAVDNISERGAGRLVVSYDASQTAIVWDLFTGDEIARFASYEPIRVAAWMKNGNVAFGKEEKITYRE